MKDKDFIVLKPNELDSFISQCDEQGFDVLEILNLPEKIKVQIIKREEPTKIMLAIERHSELKQKLKKYKEDVEQVELFSMERSDYEEKKKMCVDIIIELRELEKTIKEEFPNQKF